MLVDCERGLFKVQREALSLQEKEWAQVEFDQVLRGTHRWRRARPFGVARVPARRDDARAAVPQLW